MNEKNIPWKRIKIHVKPQAVNCSRMFLIKAVIHLHLKIMDL
ncbi:MAG: hypothetical protein ACTSVI_15235 [Promethearchaeota archaeon]